MAELPPGAAEIAAEVMRISTEPATLEQRAAALLDPLRRVVPFQAVRIALLDPERGGPVSLVSQGYDGPVRAYFESPAVVDEFELLGLNQRGPPVLIRDLPVAPASVRGWAEFLAPAGFREGLAVGLVTSDGRNLGVLGLNTDATAYPTDEARNLIGMLAPMLAHAVDPMRSFAAAARIVQDARAGILLTRAWSTLALPGLPDHRLLCAGSAVLTIAAEQLNDGDRYISFLCPYAGEPAGSGHVRVTSMACSPQPPYYVRAIVVLSEPGDLRGLTRRELEILGLLVEGQPNHDIAAALAVAERTVATHVEHILARLGARSRTVAAARALRHGLYVPRGLTRNQVPALPRQRARPTSG
jgi:DNA-binding CsgD family transcriptional regulator/GAF domain-containing protein